MRNVLVILVILYLNACNSKRDKKSEQKKQNVEMKTQSIEAQNREDAFVISHTFETDVNTLFNMWVTPDIYIRWMGPEGADMSFLSTDIKEGGSAHWQMTTPDGLTKYGKLHYKTIKPNNELVYVQFFCDKDGNFIKAPFSETYPDSLLLTARFNKEADNKVKMTVKWEIYGESTEIERMTFNDMKPFMLKGWGESFDKIEKLIKFQKRDMGKG